MRRLAVALLLVVAAGLSSGTAAAATDEDQVRAVLAGMNGSYNRADFGGFAAHICANMRSSTGFEAGWRQSRAADGPTQIIVNSVRIKGGPPLQAIANVRFESANHADTKTLDIDFVRESAEWKACEYVGGTTI